MNSQRPTFSQRLLTEIPLIFHPYVTHIENVNSDGNCGYRALNVCLGNNENSWQDMKYELLNELNRSATEYMNVFDVAFNELHYRLSTPQCWMLMPYTGVLVCNRFGVIVHCLSQSGSTTCFPIWRGPEDFMEHKTITIAHVGGNHYVMVKLEGQYPMPPITALWTQYRYQYRYPCAAAWETLYISRLQAYTQNMSSNSSPDHINLD